MNFVLMDDEVEIIVDEPYKPDNSTPTSLKNKSLFERLRDAFIDFSSRHPSILSDIRSIIGSIIEFKKSKEPLKLIDGGLSLIDGIKTASFSNVWSLLAKSKGFKYLECKNTNVAFLFKDVLPQFNSRTIKFLDSTYVQLYALPGIGDVYLYLWSNATYYIYFNKNVVDEKKLAEFLVAEKLKMLNSKFLIYHKQEDGSDYILSAFTPDTKLSERATLLFANIKQFIDAGMNRSILFYGPPGSGKSTLANTLIHNLDYKTLVFSASYKVNNISVLSYIIDLLGIEAVIVDDFDQMSSSDAQLDLLEMLNKRVKLVFGVANTLRNFQPAVLRPGRFDEVMLIDSLDKEHIVEILGELAEEYTELVKHWPVAYINEFVKRSKFSDNKQQFGHYEELNIRVKNQLEALKQ